MKSSKMVIVDKEKDSLIRKGVENGEPLYKKRLMYIQKLVKPDENSSVEYSFEELRAQAYYPIYRERERAAKEMEDLKRQ
jgi:hypothetical protein